LLHSEFLVLFFFQAEDGIRDRNVTGVQTCALPISASTTSRPPAGFDRAGPAGDCSAPRPALRPRSGTAAPSAQAGSWPAPRRAEIGRASCRERVERSVVAARGKRKTRRGDGDSHEV